MLKLTRFLYNQEEVKLSLIASLLTKKSILECYYWFSELYYSQIDILSIIWEIYFDYYALINPKFEYYITKKINEWNHKDHSTRDIKDLLYIIKNMYILKHSSDIFLLRQISLIPDLCQQYIYIKKSNSKMISNDPRLYSLLISIKKNNWIDICYYLKKIMNFPSSDINECISSQTIYESIINYFSLKNKTQLSEIWNSRIDTMDFHYILKFICSFKMNNQDVINTKMIYVSPSNEDMLEIREINEEIIQPIYKTLLYKRRFTIDSNIGSFNLTRFNISNYKKENYNWEYYASFTPLWKERILAYKGSINDKSKYIEFDDDENLELFYERYGYELDEQSKEVQEYSLLDIEKKEASDWLKYIDMGHNTVSNDWKFPIWVNEYEFPENFRFVV